MADIPDGLLSTEKVAQLLGWHVRSVRHAFLAGRLPGAKVGGRWFMRGEDLRELFRRVQDKRKALLQIKRP